MAGTTAAAFKGALFDALTTLAADVDSDLHGVQVQYADNPSQAKLERLFLGDVENGEHLREAMRGGARIRREETFDLHVWVESIGQRKTARDAEARAVDLVTALEEYLADNPRPTPAVRWAVVSGVEMKTTETTDGPRVVVDVTITVKASLL